MRTKRMALASILALLPILAGAQDSGPAKRPAPDPKYFDPKRPPERELATSVADGFTLAAVGDLILTHPVSMLSAGDPRFAEVLEILRGADVAFGNHENTLIDLDRFAGSSYPGRDDWPLIAPPSVAKDLAAMGFDLVSRANNHALDWGIEGMRETSGWLDGAGIAHAGVGESRGDARTARYLETPKGRIGLVSMASTYRDYADALPARGRAPARPGLNALRTKRTVVVTPEAMRALRGVAAALEEPRRACEVSEREAGRRRRAAAEPGDTLSLLGTDYATGARTGVRYTVNPVDRDEILRAIRQGKQHSDLLLASIHAHETGLGCEEPGDFLPVLARAAIDAGAGAFVAHGEHRLMPIEIYRGRPIFYSLANFFWGDMQEPLPEDMHENARESLASAFGDAAAATDADLTAVMNATAFDDSRVFETVVAVMRFEAGRVAEVRLHPVDLRYGERLTRSGIPRTASPEQARSILTRLQRMSRPYGTVISIEGGVGVIRIP